MNTTASADRYELLEKIGAGSFATVYRARDRELGREVAIKQIHERFLKDPAQLERYWSEAQLLASLQHPNIVTIYDVVRPKGWLILELMQGNIRDRLAGKQMDLRALRTTLAHCLRALKYLHSRGVIHGDVKPSNLMIDHRKRVKLGDFGLARRVSNVDGTQILGTAKYMSPEMVTDTLSEVGPASDLYSLGFSAYELLCGPNFEELFPGLEAFGKDRQAAWMTWHAAFDRKLPEINRVLDGVPDDLAKVIQKLVEKVPKKRYQDADQALSDLNLDLKIVNPINGETMEISTVPPEEEQAAKRKRWLAIGAFGLSATLSLALAFWPSGTSTPSGPPQTVRGVVRKIDPQTGVIEYEDPQSGVPDEYKLPAKPRIRLVRPDQPEVFVLAKEIQPGDWVEVAAATPGSGGGDLVVSRPVSSVATIKSVDYPNKKLVLTVERGRVRDELSVSVPPRARLLLNGKPCVLQEIQQSDRVEIRHVIDPGGKRGHIASEIDAFRAARSAGFVDHVEADQRKLFVRFASGNQVDELTVAPDSVIRLRSGEAIELKDLKAGDRIELELDAAIRSITVFRDAGSISGSIAEIHTEPRELILSDESGKSVTIAVADDAAVTLQGGAARLEDLRPQVDRAVIGTVDDGKGGVKASSIDVTRGIQHDRWALVIGSSATGDPQTPSRSSAVSDATRLQAALTARYAVDPQWAPRLLDPAVADVQKELKHITESAGQSAQVIVSVFGSIVIGEGEGAVPRLVLKGAGKSPTAANSIALDEIVAELAAGAGKDKLLLLDVALPKGATLEAVLASLKSPHPGTEIVATTASASPGGGKGSFASLLTEAFSGAADADRNLRITADELTTWIESQKPAVPIVRVKPTAD
ncbi:serine/threonine-protein kinase [Planctomyces sp. SH-PL14]|uniref:serine/threonine-protein kinase n=1 Tax=Planctomyces sp. SH-PL14 TaxID=1632864 RepID=UPI00078BBD7E|nr:serine/threonine-protein kinase [Planctomyces sp. SH-PL14]AMV16400.1 Serine/threonine-protein kinase PknB [Planctomyces sp. SH-PL14]